jgi:cytochrome c-type biogenesis protein CcmH/NrfG
MSSKSSHYWDIHKAVYQDQLDELDDDVRQIVLDNPQTQEAKHFNVKVKDKVQEQMKKELD